MFEWVIFYMLLKALNAGCFLQKLPIYLFFVTFCILFIQRIELRSIKAWLHIFILIPNPIDFDVFVELLLGCALAVCLLDDALVKSVSRFHAVILGFHYSFWLQIQNNFFSCLTNVFDT